MKGSPAFDFGKIVNHLEAKTHETVLEVNLDAMVDNFNFFRSHLKPTTGLVAMVKASGYGAGSLELAKTLQAYGAAYLAVAVGDEGARTPQGWNNDAHHGAEPDGAELHPAFRQQA